MQKTLELFYEICKIPHGSGNTQNLKNFIIQKAKESHCNVAVDNAQNIHISKGKPTICLQAHYDMVHIGGEIKPFIDNGKLVAKDSSLGADNGIGVAAILALMQERDNFEALITNDEEIGMLGAKALNLPIISRNMLNLDSENINEIVVGCAGGFDCDITLPFTYKPCKEKQFYQIATNGFVGGHSGIDINKNIPNAIIELVMLLCRLGCEIVEINGGEKRNSIPVHARAIIVSNEPLERLRGILDSTKYSKNFSISPINSTYDKVFTWQSLLPILQLHSGIYHICGNNVIDSLNISLIDNANLKIMVRSNRADLLQRRMDILKLTFDNCLINGLYMPWERKDSSLLSDMQRVYEKNKIPYTITEIHAGLECGILEQKCGLEAIISIGPTINNPHSKAEWLDLHSLEVFCKILQEFYR